MNMVRLLSSILIAATVFQFGCYRCEEVSDFHFNSIDLSLIDSESEINILETELEGGFYPNVQIFRNGQIDSTSLSFRRIRIDDWDLENLTTQNGELNTEMEFEIEYEIHFITDTISQNQINIDTLNIQYTVINTECNVVAINELALMYNDQIIYEGSERFSITARI